MMAEISQPDTSAIGTGSGASATSLGGLKKLVRAVKGEAEIEAIAAALDRNGWNRRRTAVELNISYKALLYKMRQYGIEHATLTGTN